MSSLAGCIFRRDFLHSLSSLTFYVKNYDIPSPSKTTLEDTVEKELTEIQNDGLENLAGFIAFKLRKSESSLGYIATDNDPTYTWINHLSEGGLMKPNENFLSKCRELNTIFEKINGNSLKICDNYIQEHIDSSRDIDLSENVKSLFFRCKMFFRIRILNKKLKEFSTVKNRKIIKIST